MDIKRVRRSIIPSQSSPSLIQSVEAPDTLPMPSQAKLKPRSRKKLSGVIMVVVLVFGLGTYFAVRGLNAPAIGTIKNAPVNDTAVEGVAKKATLKGKYIAFDHDSQYEKKPITAQPGWLEQYYLVTPEQFSKTLAVSVRQTPQRGLADEPSYHLRQLKPQTYREQVKVINGSTVHIWQKAEAPAEAVAFIEHKQLLAILALTVQHSDDNPSSEMEAILASLHWQD